MTAPPAATAARAYAGQPWSIRAHVAVRRRTVPIAALDELVPDAGAVLDWGCGHGLVSVALAQSAPARQVQGVDLDGPKVDAARQAAAQAGLGERARFEVVGADELPTGTWAAVVFNDVLYLQAPAVQEALVRAAARAVGPGGVVVCKEVGRAPRWKVRLASVQEQLAVKVLRITETGGGLHPFPDPDVVGGWLADEGLEVEVRPIGRGYHVAHVAVVGRRRESGRT